MRSVGIDVGRYSIKVVEVFASNRDYQITNAKEYIILNPESNDQEIDILQTLNEISKEFDTDTARVTCSVRQQYVSTRKLFFPFKERIKIQKSLAFELEDDIPLSIDKTIYDSKIIRFHDKSAEIIAMACVADEIEKTIDLFKRGKIDPEIISPEFSAIANLYEKWYKSPEEVSQEIEESYEKDKMIVQIGHSKTFVGVVSKKHLIWGRSIMWGAEKIAGSISQAFSVPFLTALEMMPSKAFLLLTTAGADKDQIKMSESVAKSIEPFIQSLRLTTLLANTEYGANIESIELLGGAGNIKNICPYLTQELNTPCNLVNPIHNLSDAHMRNHAQLDSIFQVALGLAIEGLKRPFNPATNFRQMHLAKKNQSFEKLWEKWNYTAKVICIAWCAYLIYGISLDSISTNLEVISNDTLVDQAGKIANLKGGSATQNKIRQYIKENIKKAKLVKIYEELDEVNSPLKWINDVSQILPSNKEKTSYDIRQFFVRDDEVNIQGVAIDDKTIEEILKALKGVAVKAAVKTVPITIAQENNKKSFAYTFKVKRIN
jgi:general secretion pathway protein L